MEELFTIKNALIGVVIYVYTICAFGLWYMVRGQPFIHKYKKTSLIILYAVWPLLVVSVLIQAYINKGEENE